MIGVVNSLEMSQEDDVEDDALQKYNVNYLDKKIGISGRINVPTCHGLGMK